MKSARGRCARWEAADESCGTASMMCLAAKLRERRSMGSLRQDDSAFLRWSSAWLVRSLLHMPRTFQYKNQANVRSDKYSSCVSLWCWCEYSKHYNPVIDDFVRAVWLPAGSSLLRCHLVESLWSQRRKIKRISERVKFLRIGFCKYLWAKKPWESSCGFTNFVLKELKVCNN